MPTEIESKWQKKWMDNGTFASDLTGDNKYYVLAEFPYPSGDLHMGHWFTWGGADIFARFKRMQGYNVFFPIGFDAFGLPAENAAIKRNIHPQDWTRANIFKMKEQFLTMGPSFSFDHEVITCEPEYYRWNQWIFLKMLERGIAYRGKSLANWCPSCQTVLANEGVENGKCWRCGSEVIQKDVEQWFFRITDYADRLLWAVSSNLTLATSNLVDWPQSVREGQNSWIGKSEGMEINFKLVASGKSQGSSKNKPRLLTLDSSDSIIVYTSYPETIFGVTYLVLAPEHPIVQHLLSSQFTVNSSQLAQVRDYVDQAKKKSELERKTAEKNKTGVFTGLYVINPVNGEKVPVWIADYVLGGYGTGAVMGVPGSDHRDYAFAATYSLLIRRVIAPSANSSSQLEQLAQEPIGSVEDVLEEGVLVNSGEFTGLRTPDQARPAIADWLESQGFAKRSVQYHLHDWSISRQRYWGTPIPVIHCPDCGIVPVPEEQLPVELPYNVDYTPKGKSPLASNEEWHRVSCPKCGKPATRDADTMDTFVDSSWYFFRYLSPQYKQGPFDKKVASEIMPVDIYFGGAEHTLGHTMYSRFFTKFLKDIGWTDLEEYASRRINHGIVLGPDGNKMSKSKGNVVNPDDEVKKYGADAVRVYLAFFMPYDGTGPWISERVWGAFRFLDRVWGLQEKLSVISHQSSESLTADSEASLKAEDLFQMHRTIKRVTEEIEATKFNTAVAALMEWLNYLSKKNVTKEEFSTFLKLLSPIAPHITEELWQMVHSSQFTVHSKHKENLVSAVNPEPTIFKSIHTQPWPKFEQEYLTLPEIKIVIQVNGKPRDVLSINKDQESEEQLLELVKTSKAAKFLEAKEIKKTVYIPGKILSLVTD